MENKTLLQADAVIEKYPRDPGRLIHVLQEIQKTLGYVSLETQRGVAEHLKVPYSTVYGLVSFYNYFKTTPSGRHTINVCMGTACYVRGAQRLIDKIKAEVGIRPGEVSSDQRFSLEEVRCVGCCAIGPVLTIDGNVYGSMKPEKLGPILDLYK